MRSPGPSLAMALAFGAAVLLRMACVPAAAGLGDPATSVPSDVAHMKGELRVRSAAGYTVQQIATPSGTVVKEYVSPTGIIFAVSWRGPSVPDLRQLLSTYFPQFVAAERSQRLGHHHLAIRQGDLVVHASGHMRAFFGAAYVPSLLPPNFSVSDIQ